MMCPKCKCGTEPGHRQVRNTQFVRDSCTRRRVCGHCGHAWMTIEIEAPLHMTEYGQQHKPRFKKWFIEAVRDAIAAIDADHEPEKFQYKRDKPVWMRKPETVDMPVWMR